MELEFTVPEIERLVIQFYDKVRRDPLLGPVFAEHIADWGPHLDRMVSFWRTILRGERLFAPDERGGPHVIHRRLEAATLAHYARWMTLFEETARGVFLAEEADAVIARARSIGEVLSGHLRERSPRLAGFSLGA